jgi:hypothetical protein
MELSVLGSNRKEQIMLWGSTTHCAVGPARAIVTIADKPRKAEHGKVLFFGRVIWLIQLLAFPYPPLQKLPVSQPQIIVHRDDDDLLVRAEMALNGLD